MKLRFVCRSVLTIAVLTAPLVAQQAAIPSSSGADPARGAAGSSPVDAGPLAANLSGRIDPADVRKAMVRVADWQLAVAEPAFNQQWTFATLYDGLLAASEATGDPRYRAAVERAAADKWQWTLLTDRLPHADDLALAKAYEALYSEYPSPERLAATVAWANRLAERQAFHSGAPGEPLRNPRNIVWWWCDALYMAPPVLARLSRLTHDPRYLRYMDTQWRTTSALLYDPQQHLFSRDASYLHSRERNGQKVFWSRGNGWVLGGLVRVLADLPPDFPGRKWYEQQFAAIANRIALLQQPDGLWRAGLLDQAAYPQPEVSGSAFFVYAMAWGVRSGLLPRTRFLPVIQRGWAGMVSHIYADGRLGNIQPIGAAPDAVTPSSSYVYGVGAFLLAGAELVRLSPGRAGHGTEPCGKIISEQAGCPASALR